MGRASILIRRLGYRLSSLGPLILRISLSAVFIWFGALKVAGASPVEDLVIDTVPGAEAWWFIPLLGGLEVVLGFALLFGEFPLVTAALVLHLVGTFGVMVTQPDLVFQNGNPLLLTTEGEFVVKNLVLLGGALTVAGMGRQRRAWSARLRMEGAR